MLTLRIINVLSTYRSFVAAVLALFHGFYLDCFTYYLQIYLYNIKYKSKQNKISLNTSWYKVFHGKFNIIYINWHKAHISYIWLFSIYF